MLQKEKMRLDNLEVESEVVWNSGSNFRGIVTGYREKKVKNGAPVRTHIFVKWNDDIMGEPVMHDLSNQYDCAFRSVDAADEAEVLSMM